MKKIIAAIVLTACTVGLFGCGSGDFNSPKNINTVVRESGSGTHSAFIELFGIQVKGEDGSKKDMTTKEAIQANQTGVMLTNIANDTYGIGYVSLGALNDTVKAVKIDGADATAENVKNGSYKISRPFLIVTKPELTELAGDFIAFILSLEGQAVVAKEKYIAVDEAAAAYVGSRPAGKIVIVGSSSITPVMEKLKEAYLAINSSAQIDIQELDSTAGIKAANDGTCDIGMASRELKEEESAALTPVKIAIDGIAVIVNTSNPVEELTKEQVKSIFTGESTVWSGFVK